MYHIDKYKVAKTAKYSVLILYAITTILPFLWVVLSSVKTHSEVIGNPFKLPSEIVLNNFVLAWKGAQVPNALLNSTIYACVSVVLVVLVTSMAAYIIARIRPSKSIYLFYTLGIMVPIHAVIIPFVLIIRSFGLINSRPGIILAYVTANISFSFFILVSFMKTLPKDLEDAAMIDGCSRTRTFFNIILPISKPGLATVATFAFMHCWNDFLLALIITVSPALRSLNVACYNLRAQYLQRYGLIAAGIVILMIPVIIMYVLFQEQVIKGLTAGAIKG